MALTAAFGIPLQETMGQKGKRSVEPRDMRLRRRLEQIEKLEKKRKRLIQLLDTFIAKNRLKQQTIGE